MSLTPCDETGAFAEPIRVSVPSMGVGEGTATTLALAVYERLVIGHMRYCLESHNLRLVSIRREKVQYPGKLYFQFNIFCDVVNGDRQDAPARLDQAFTFSSSR